VARVRIVQPRPARPIAIALAATEWGAKAT